MKSIFIVTTKNPLVLNDVPLMHNRYVLKYFYSISSISYFCSHNNLDDIL